MKKAEKAQAAAAGETSPSRQGKWTPAEDEQLAAALQQMAYSSSTPNTTRNRAALATALILTSDTEEPYYSSAVP